MEQLNVIEQIMIALALIVLLIGVSRFSLVVERRRRRNRCPACLGRGHYFGLKSVEGKGIVDVIRTCPRCGGSGRRPR